MCVAVLLSNSKSEEQQDNNFISPQEVKLRCGIRDVMSILCEALRAKVITLTYNLKFNLILLPLLFVYK